MCKQHEVLHEAKKGYVTYCHSCENVHVAYGTTALILTPEQTYQFCKQLEETIERHENRIHPKEKSLIFSTDSSSVKLVYCLNEAEELMAMLSQGMLMYECNQIIANSE